MTTTANRFQQKAQKSATDKLKERFTPEQKERISPLVKERRKLDPQFRRDDYKGARKQLNVRVSEELIYNLGLLSFTSGITLNDLTNQSLEELVQQELIKIQSQYSDAEWSALESVFKLQNPSK